MELDVIYNEDCLEGMKRIPDGSVDLVLTDPPYGTIQGLWGVNWDNPLDNNTVFNELSRVLRQNGKAILFGIGFELDPKYFDIACQRLDEAEGGLSYLNTM